VRRFVLDIGVVFCLVSFAHAIRCPASIQQDSIIAAAVRTPKKRGNEKTALLQSGAGPEMFCGNR
jgi:hypothetical protein